MKKWICLLAALALIFSLAACTNEQGGKEEAATWTREGYFMDENDNFLSISASPYEEYDGWYVGCFLGDDMYGWVIPQEGDTLHGNIVPEYESGEFIVTVTEEGEDGVMLTTEAGDVYHFTPYDMPEATIFVTMNIEGMGRIAYALEDEELELDDEYPFQSAQINLAEPTVYQMGAKADDGWRFVKWTKDGEDFSTEPVLTLTLDETADYIAVFEAE